MRKQSLFIFIKRLNQPVFTTHQLSAISKKSPSTVIQGLRILEREGLIVRIYRGIWAISERYISPYEIIPLLFPLSSTYLSFISALHLYGIIEQIPQQITLASISHTRFISTKVGMFSVHHISPEFFCGFDWYKKEGKFLVAEPEKALIDCLYLSAYKKKQFIHFPELHFPKGFSFRRAKGWIKRIPNPNIKKYVEKRLNIILKKSRI